MSELAENQTEKKAAPSSSPSNEATSPEIQALKASVTSLNSKIRSYKRQISLYNRNKKKFTEFVAKINLPSASDEAGESTSKKDSKKTLVIFFYRLLRSISISTNIIDLENSDEDKQVIPVKFTDEINSIFEEDKSGLEKLKKALKAESMKESIKELPDELSEKVVTGFSDFIPKFDQGDTIKHLESSLPEWINQIKLKRLELKKLIGSKKSSKPPKNKKKNPKKPVSEPSSNSEAPVEERFREMVKEVKQRVFSVDLKKDDFKTYSDIQKDIDSFLNEAVSEILSIKNNLKAKFEKIQSAKEKAKKVN